MKSAAIRELFLSYFEQLGHQCVPSSSLIPAHDPSLLFTNAGMVPFKEVFLGHQPAPAKRTVSIQRCVRAGGKHNDLERVGYTKRHHTFFEMLGNFSFGDYFKQQAIHFAWQFLTSKDYLHINPDKLIVTVYKDDEESYRIWRDEIGLAATTIIRIGDHEGMHHHSDNFWSMGDTGPCGPCTEIFYDHGPALAGGPPGSAEQDGDRFVEIWNVVFMQFNRQTDGQLTPLPHPSVDTGMGLERLAAVMQGVNDNYAIDSFQHLLAAASKITGMDDHHNTSLRVIVDHIRSCAFLIADGILPGNEGRNYVLRRLIRRAARHGHKLGMTQAFFYRLVAPLIDLMGKVYPLLIDQQSAIEKVLLNEEQQFAETLEQGLKRLENDLAALTDRHISGDILFKLYDTYGFPVDIIADIAKERDLSIDLAGFEQAMAAQRERARENQSFSHRANNTALSLPGSTTFTGYQALEQNSKVVALLKDQQTVTTLAQGESGQVVLDTTPFYAESGGQVGDTGRLCNNSVAFTVTDTQKNGAHYLHTGQVTRGALTAGTPLTAAVDQHARQAIACNHSATHLLHAALRQLLGDHVTQRGSLVNAQRLRFDFSYPQALDQAQLTQIENTVNEQIRHNTRVDTTLTSLVEAKQQGAMMLFGEKYADDVRLLTMGDGFSVELCGGIHVTRTGDMGLIKIISESGVAAGVRRIEAITGNAALSHYQHIAQQLSTITRLLNTKPDAIVDKLQQQLAEHKQREKDYAQVKAELFYAEFARREKDYAQVKAQLFYADFAHKATIINNVKVFCVCTPYENDTISQNAMDQFTSRLSSSAIIVLGFHTEKYIRIFITISKDVSSRYDSGVLMKHLAIKFTIKGGGRSDKAQGGGENKAKDKDNNVKTFSIKLSKCVHKWVDEVGKETEG